MTRWIRLTMLCLVLAGMAGVTWLLNVRYWHTEDYRAVTPGVLYVADGLSREFVERFRAHFTNLTVVDLVPDGAGSGADATALAEVDRLGLLQHIPVAADTLPTAPQAMQFLTICSDSNSHPVVLYAGRCASPAHDVRVATLEAAYVHWLRGRSLDEAIVAAGLDGHAAEGQVRELISTLQRRKPPQPEETR